MNKTLSALFIGALSTISYAHTPQFSYANKATLNRIKEEPGVINFSAIGDYGNNSDAEMDVAERVRERHPDFVITLGDNNYVKGCWDTIDKNIGKYYSNFIGNYKGEYGQGAPENQFFPSIGNHDWRGLEECPHDGNLPYLDYFTLPNTGLYYDFVKGPVHFYAIDSDPHEPDGNKKGSMQYEWLKQKLAESQECFNVVYFHHPAYSSGDHGSTKEMQWDFAKLGADAVLSGHDHDYERIMRDGIAYFVNGAGGASLYKFGKKVKGSVYRYNDKHGYMMGYANDHHLIFEFYNTDNEMKDSLMLTKLCKH